MIVSCVYVALVHPIPIKSSKSLFLLSQVQIRLWHVESVDNLPIEALVARSPAQLEATFVVVFCGTTWDVLPLGHNY